MIVLFKSIPNCDNIQEMIGVIIAYKIPIVGLKYIKVVIRHIISKNDLKPLSLERF